MADVSLDQQIMQKIQKLDEGQKQRVLEFVESELNAAPLPLETWLRQATAFRQALRAKYGDGHFFGVQEMLDEIREEASWPRR